MQRSRLRSLLLPLAICLAPAASFAAPVFPGASGVGLEPPPGMQPAKTFNGFLAGPASIVITEMPKQAYAQIDHSRDDFNQRFGSKADDVEVNGVHGFRLKGTQQMHDLQLRKWILVLDGPDETALVSAQVPKDDTAISDAQIDAALRSVVFRPRPGLDQQIAALPFSVADTAGFRMSATALGATLIMVDGPKDVDPTQRQAQIVISSSPAKPPAGDLAEFAKAQLQSFQAVRTTEILSAKSFDKGGARWAEVQAKGSEGQQETPVSISYFLRFGAGDVVSIICIAPQAAAAQYADRFKSVALSVTPKG